MAFPKLKMLTLIAESKTMDRCDLPVSRAEYERHRPLLSDHAARIVASLGDMSAAELAKAVKISAPMASRHHRMLRDFMDKTVGARAIEAFTGVVFKAFSYATLSVDARREADSEVRIISSLYGWLRPSDIIKAYRFDFTTPLAPDGGTFAAYWRGPVTDCLLRDIEATGRLDVLDLLPGDAARCVDFKRMAASARIWKAAFREIVSGTVTRTPNAGKLKILRGRLLRHIVEQGLQSPDQLLGVDDDEFMAESIDQASGTITFRTAAPC